MEMDFPGFIVIANNAGTVIYSKAHLTPLFGFRNCHDLDLPNNTVALSHCLVWSGYAWTR